MEPKIKNTLFAGFGFLIGIVFALLAVKEENQTVGIKFEMPEEIGLAQPKDFLVVEKVVENDSLKVITLGFFGKN